MKKNNRKGFTLIELLAVIIILGVLMIIAIPSVTAYIQNSRKSAFVDSGLNYVKSGINTVNSGNKMRFYDTSTLYLIPAGHEDGKSCISVESGGQSPFSDKWAYAYVGVTYDGKGYTYYYVAEDEAGQGVPFLTQTDLQNLGADALYSSSLNNTVLKADYSGSANVSYVKADGENLVSTIAANLVTPSEGYSSVTTKAAVTDGTFTIGTKEITHVVVLGAPTCTYQEGVTA